MQSNERDIKLAELASTFGLDIQENPVSGGLYEPVTIDGKSLYLSGQIPKCSGLMKPDTHLGENARQIEVSDDQTTPLLYS